MKEKEISSKKIYDGLNFRLIKKIVELPDGKTAEREIIETKHKSAVVLVLDKEFNIYLVKTFRTGIWQERLEIPGGRFYPERGETPEATAVKESREEVGMEPKKLELLFETFGGGTWSSHSFYYLGTEAVPNPLERDWDEVIETVKMPFSDYVKYLFNKPMYEGRGGEFKAMVLTARKLGLLDIKT